MLETVVDRVTELECQLSEQQQTLDELSSVLHEKISEFDRMQRRLEKLERGLMALMGGDEPREAALVGAPHGDLFER